MRWLRGESQRRQVVVRDKDAVAGGFQWTPQRVTETEAEHDDWVKYRRRQVEVWKTWESVSSLKASILLMGAYLSSMERLVVGCSLTSFHIPPTVFVWGPYARGAESGSHDRWWKAQRRNWAVVDLEVR